MALVFPPTQDPTELSAIALIRTIEAVQPIYQNSPSYAWFRLLMDTRVKPGYDVRISRCAVRLIISYLPIIDSGLQWTLFVWHNCIVPSSWPSKIRPLYNNLESATRGLYGFATNQPPPTVDALAAEARRAFNYFMTPAPAGPGLTTIDLNPVRGGYVQLRNYLQFR